MLLEPSYADAHNNIGMSLLELGRAGMFSIHVLNPESAHTAFPNAALHAQDRKLTSPVIVRLCRRSVGQLGIGAGAQACSQRGHDQPGSSILCSPLLASCQDVSAFNSNPTSRYFGTMIQGLLIFFFVARESASNG